MPFDINSIQLKIFHSPRKNLSLELTLDDLLIRAPCRMSVREIASFLNKKRAWVEKHWQLM